MRPGRVVVSGGSSGLGAAVVRAVTGAGGHAAVLDVSAPAEGVPYVAVDVADTPAVSAGIAACVDMLGGIDAVVTAAGIDRCGPLDQVPADDWEQVVRVNLLGTAAVIRAALPHLLASEGRIATIASTLGFRALGDASAYCASKAGVVALTRALSRELEGRVDVTLVVPGGMATSFFDGRAEQYRPAPDADLCSPDDVARAVVFALSMPPGCVMREVMVAPRTEPSWP